VENGDMGMEGARICRAFGLQQRREPLIPPLLLPPPRLSRAEYRAFSAPALSSLLRRRAAHDFLLEADKDGDGRATRDEFLAGELGRRR
jgi:hypothetical protein